MEAGTPPDRVNRDERPRPPRVFLSYAHDSDAHRDAVRNLWVFLCENGVDARIDLVAAERRQDWTLWMEEQVAAADHVLVIASPAYKQRAGHEADPDQGRGVQYEARLVRNLFYENQSDLQRFLPVVLPGGSTDDVPTFLSPAIATVYRVSAFTVPGAQSLLRVLHGRPGEVQPAIGPAPHLRTREHTLGGIGASTIQGASTGWPVQVGLVPLLADCFQERPEIELLREAVRSGGTAVVTQVLAGLGGVGKSQLAAAFAHERAPDVDVLVWVDARSRQSVIAGFARAAARLGLQVSDADEAAQLLLGWLRSAQEHTWLVVLDDVSDPADLQGLWPTGHRGNTVVTTRRTDAALFNRGRQRIAVGLFSRGQAKRYIREKLAVDEGFPVLDGVDQLIKDLQFLPLALAQATAFLQDRGETCAGYRRRFVDRQRTLAELFPADALADDYQATVATTWAISIDAADTLAPTGLSRPLLESASLLTTNGFAAELLGTADVAAYLAAHATCNGTTRPRNVTASDCRDALTNLSRLSLVSVNRNADGAFVSVHALVQRATLQHLDAGRRYELTWRTAWSVLRCWPEVEQDGHRAQMLRDSATALATRTGDNLWVPRQHPLLRRAGRSFRESGSVHAALDFWRQLCRASDRILGADHPDTLSNRHEYAGAIRDTGNVTAAIAELAKLLPDEIRVLGEDSPEAITTRHSIASYNGEAGHFTEALAGLEAILPDRIRVFGADDRHTLTTRANIARFRGECGDPAAAASEYNKVARDRARVLGPDDRETLEGRSGLAYWKGKAGSPRRAAREFAALAIDYARVLHPDDHQTLTTRHDAAKWLGEAGDSTEAAAALEELVLDMVRVLGAEHPDTTATRGSHADWVGEAGDPKRAVALFQDVIGDMELFPGPASLDTFACRGNLAHWQWEAGDRGDAIRCYKKLVADMAGTLGNDHARVVAVRKKLDRYLLQR